MKRRSTNFPEGTVVPRALPETFPMDVDLNKPRTAVWSGMVNGNPLWVSLLLGLLFLSGCGDKKIKQFYKKDPSKLKFEWEYDSDNRKHGECRGYFMSGELKSIEFYEHGARDSVCTYYWKNGNVRKEVHYQNEVNHGPSTWFYEDGSKKREVKYDKGRAHGEMREYHPNGNLLSTVKVQYSRRYGEWLKFYPDKQIEEEGFYDGDRLHGQFSRYYRNGRVKVNGSYQQAAKVDDWLGFYGNGQLAWRVSYEEGEPAGPFKILHSNGQTKVDGLFGGSGGMLHGDIFVFDEKGKQLEKQVWKKGFCKTCSLDWLKGVPEFEVTRKSSDDKLLKWYWDGEELKRKRVEE